PSTYPRSRNADRNAATLRLAATAESASDGSAVLRSWPRTKSTRNCAPSSTNWMRRTIPSIDELEKIFHLIWETVDAIEHRQEDEVNRLKAEMAELKTKFVEQRVGGLAELKPNLVAAAKRPQAVVAKFNTLSRSHRLCVRLVHVQLVDELPE